jgi:hypothetical protein
MWYIIGGAIIIIVLGYVITAIIGAMAFKKKKAEFDAFKEKVERNIDDDRLQFGSHRRIRRP